MPTIRMYNVGLGDCFLLRFEAPDRPHFLLIDCGLFRGSDAEKDTLKAVATDIAQTTGGHIDVVVATHEHQDHLSGFTYAQEVFQSKITIGSVWLAWTEKPGDPMADKLRGTMQGFTGQLEATVARLKTDTKRQFSPESLDAVESVMEFAGFDGVLAVAGQLGVNQQALKFLKDFPVEYKEPGTIATMDGLPNVRFYILGPPRSDLILKSNPSKKNPEVYNFAGNDRSNYVLMVPAWDDTDEDRDMLDSLPFDMSYQVNLEESKSDPFFYKFYWNDFFEQEPEPSQPQAYRRIDNDWLFGLGNLALQLDSDTNNTSLVMAIELVDTGRVLLFPGDAQVGNWLSWDSYLFPDNVTAADLLARTVFYKVGHHGSHNATLRELGLERMASQDLVAMIPVDRDFAQNTKKWEMPFEKLYTRLLEKTKGRVLIADSQFPHEPLPGSQQPAALPATDWNAFQTNVTFSPNLRPSSKGVIRPLWTEFVIH